MNIRILWVLWMLVFLSVSVGKVSATSTPTPTPIPNPIWVWKSIDYTGNRGYFTPVTNSICSAYYIEGYGNYAVVKFLGNGAEILIVDGACEINASMSASERAIWVSANYPGSYSVQEVIPATVTPTITLTPTSTSTSTPTSTSTSTPTWTPTATWTSTSTSTVTPSVTNSVTPTETATSTSTSTSTPTPTPTWTWTPTSTSTSTNTSTRTSTPSVTRTATLAVTTIPKLIINWGTGANVTSAVEVKKGAVCWGDIVGSHRNSVVSFTKDMGFVTIQNGGCQIPGRQSPNDIKNFLYTRGFRYQVKVIPAPPTLTPTLTPTVIPRLVSNWNSGGVFKPARPLKGTICWGDVGDHRSVIAEFSVDYRNPISVKGSCQWRKVNSTTQIQSYLKFREGRNLRIISLP